MEKAINVAASALFLILLFSCVSFAGAQTILVEAEAFENLGGWVVDQQFMDQMGSPFLLAHGLGTPIADAETRIRPPETGKYRIFVRTRDWVANWKAPGAPGRFQLLVDGKALSKTFGTEGANWRWHSGGTIEIDRRNITLALHDLTGFEGRCDAVLLTTDMNLIPPNEDPAMRKWRRKLLGLGDKPIDAGRFDLVVVGGGMAGTCSAISAARLGCKVALIQDRPVLGGNNSSEVRVWLGGKTNYDPYPRIGDVVAELEPARRAHYGPDNTAELYEDQRRIDLVRAEKNIDLYLWHRANGVETNGNSITAVIAQDVKTGRTRRFAGRYFADCTGDGCIGALAGAHFDMTLDGHMGRCNLWNAVETGERVLFDHCPWAIDLSEKPFPAEFRQLGAWFWEAGFYHNPFEKSEHIRDLNFRAMYGAWDALKNTRGLYPNHRLNWAAYVSGKRESRRLLGDIILTKQDIVGGIVYPDGCVPATWPIDLHLPDPVYDKTFEGDEFISKAYYTQYDEPYWVPYRCLYSRNISNLFMAGRDISVTHEALGAVRVMRTCGMIGEVVGMAASLCKQHDATPRGVYENYLDDLKDLAKRGAGKPINKNDPDFAQAIENGKLACEGFRRCRDFVAGWLAYADPKTGLIPRNLNQNKDIWNAQDSAADNYPFMVLTAAVTDRPLFEGRMLDMLRTETKLTSRIDAMPDTYSFTRQGFQDAQPNLDRIIFGSSEYVKDGLVPLTEWLGQSPWSQRMLSILDDIWKYAPIETPFGNIPSTSQEVNGEMLQTLSRMHYMTGEGKYLDWAIRLGNYYLLGKNHPTHDEDRLRLRDHGCEILSGLCELYAAVSFASPEKKKAYQKPIHEMLDRVLEVGRNEHGLFYNWINPKTADHDTALADTWGYNLNGFYTVYLIDKTDAYRQATLKALENLNDHYKNYKWEGSSSDGYADSIESALNLYNREPVDSAASWIDSQTKVMWAMQKPDGVIEGWHGDGNFARTTIMYCLWKTKGLTIQPWREDIAFGAARDGDTLKIAIRAEKPWQGKLIFDTPRHTTNMKLPLDWPRINQFPEWFTAKPEKRYELLDLTANTQKTLTGKQLAEGIALGLDANAQKHILVQ